MPFAINDRCTGCGACLEECPTGAIVALGKPGAPSQRYLIDTDYCQEHQFCVTVCPENAIHRLTFLPKNDKRIKR